MTISFFSRIFSRANGIVAARENFSSRLSSRPPNSAPSRNSAISASIASALPASVPLMPSWASSTLPFSAEPGADRAQRLAQLAEIRQRGKLVEGGDFDGMAGVYQAGGRGETPCADMAAIRFRALPSTA